MERIIALYFYHNLKTRMDFYQNNLTKTVFKVVKKKIGNNKLK